MTGTQPANGIEGYEVILTDSAAEVVRGAFESEQVNPETSYLRIGAKPGGCSGYRFEMDYSDKNQLSGKDVVYQSQGVNLVVEKTCLTDILGSLEIDYQTGSMMERGFKFRRLSTGAMCGCGESFTPIKQEASQ